MFKGSRKHAPQAPMLTRETANPNAATAAASAFARRDSNASLSSAAAAAALRSRPTSPTIVSEVQSKRIHRRNTSQTSLGSRAASRDRSRTRELTRSPSGSMIERTFRSPSPGRSPAPRERHVPPVPNLPLPASPVANGVNNSGQTVHMQPFMTASQKLKKKNSNNGDQGTWFGSATVRDSPIRNTDIISHVPSEPRPGSVSPSVSFNFSYPRNALRSPSPGPSADQTLVYDANSRRMVPKSELMGRSEPAQDFSEKPKKKKSQDVSRSGSHLAKGTVGRTQAPALETEDPPKKKKGKKKQEQDPHELPREVAFIDDDLSDDEIHLPDQTRPRLVKKPSVVREEPELEEQEERQDQQQEAAAIAAQAIVTPKKKVKKTKKKVLTPEPKQHEEVRRTREVSASPARSAHFAPSSSTDQLAVRHEPPPRSLSPRKSALKPQSPTRGISPSDDGSDYSARNLSPQPKEDAAAAAARKKAVRVSWDDSKTLVVGEATQAQETDSPIIPSPQALKKPWHSIVTKYAKKESVSLDEEETMSPRPALPLFGSVREKKTRELEERPLVRPPQPLSGPDSAAVDEVGQSSDSAPGITGTQEQSSKNEANISKYREPLPTAKPTDEESSDAKTEAADDETKEGTLATSALTEATTETDVVAESGVLSETKNDPETEVQSNTEVPTISISQSSPRAPHGAERSSYEFVELPGGFPDDPNATDGSITPQAQSDAEDSDDASTPTRSPETTTAGTTPQMGNITEEEEETDRGSLYSDAHEELDEEGDGFLSLDAVLTTSADSKGSKKLYQIAIAKSKENARNSIGAEATSDSSDGVRTSNDWENAKSYWRSLTAEKRRQLEREAMEEAEEDDVETTPTQKSKGKKKANGGVAQAIEPAKTDRVYQIQPGTAWSEQKANGSPKQAKQASTISKASGAAIAPKLRQSMRSEEPKRPDPALQSQPGSMRKSMRTGPPPTPASARAPNRRRSKSAEPELATSAAGLGMRKSLRAMSSNGDISGPRMSLREGRPMSYHASASTTALDSFQGHKRGGSNDGSGSSFFGMTSKKPAVKRRGSDSSESSFTRVRPRTSEVQGFRMSMRGSMRSPSPNAAGNRRGSVTSLPPSMGGGMAAGRMRQSLRSESTDNLPKKRMSAFGRPAKPSKTGRSKSGSRFADSSDEDEGGPSFFSSRFADSSDEDDSGRPQSKGKGLAAKSMRADKGYSPGVSGIRNSTLRSDSPELDSDEDLAPAKRGDGELRRNRSGRGAILPAALPTVDISEPIRPASSRRGSFMSILRRKKDPATRISRDVTESAARRDTNLERSADELNMLRSNSSSHKRGPSWPLPEGVNGDGSPSSPTLGALQRPSTSGGLAAHSSKSKFLRRRSTSQGMVGLGHEPPSVPDEPVPVIPDQHKKKKFGALRKMFGIHN